MHTRSQTRNLHNQQHQAPPPVVEPFNLEDPFENPPPPPPPPMADNRTMAQLLEAPTEGYEDAIVVPEINANFELKHGLINLVQNKQFFGHDKEDPHAHIRYFNKITSTMKFPNVPSTSVKLMLFPFSLEGAARIWLEKEPPRSIQTWDDLVSKFINKFFPPSKTTNLYEITRFQQRFDETFYEAWDRFNDLLRACPHHGFSELHQLDTFYNALNSNDQDSLNSAAGGNFLDKMPRDCLRIIESKSKVRNSRNKPVVAKVSASTSTPGISSEVAELKEMVKALLLDKKNQSPAPTPVKAVEESCVTCVCSFPTKLVPATSGNVIEIISKNMCLSSTAANSTKKHRYRARFQIKISTTLFSSRFKTINGKIKETSKSYNQNRRNFNQAPTYQTRLIKVSLSTSGVQPPCLSMLPPIQAPAPQIQGVSKEDFHSYVKLMMRDEKRNMQTQEKYARKTHQEEYRLYFGTLPSNTVPNPKEDLEGYYHAYWCSLQGTRDSYYIFSKVVNVITETQRTRCTANNGSTEDVPLLVPMSIMNQSSEPTNASISATRPNQKASIHFLQEEMLKDVVRKLTPN
ncbi:reverse transcriptase domain-containing protein [Tanacetum coccineum]|uniref:Reverse transcriptase domain-containing protein n=1 Tax=Tanacetum coccineum TaxID=301880 RepID=A0ABQ5EL34_9ASTR